VAAYFGGREIHRRDQHRRQLALLELVKDGRYDEALQAGDRLLLLDPADPVTHAMYESAALSAAAEHLSGAVRAMSATDPTAALAELDRASCLLPEVGALRELHDEIHSRVTADPFIRDLKDQRAAVRLAALERLQRDLLENRRPLSEARLATLVLEDSSPRVRSLGFSVCTLSRSSALLLDGLSLRPRDLPRRLDAETFYNLHRSLCAIGDETARQLLCLWTLDLMEELDSLRPGDTTFLPPGIEVALTEETGGNFTAAWVLAAPGVEPERLLAEVPRLRRREDLLPLVVDALAAIGTPPAAAAVADLARHHYLAVGVQSLGALVEMGAHSELLGLLRSPLPLELRLTALELGGPGLASMAPERLAALVKTSPDAAVRSRALSLLSSGESEGWNPATALLSAVDDPELRIQALRWLERLDGRTRIALSWRLLGHPDPAVRRRAAETLATAEPRWDRLPAAALKLFSPRAAVRRHAIEALLVPQSRRACALALQQAVALAGEILQHQLSEPLGRLAPLRYALQQSWARLRERLSARAPPGKETPGSAGTPGTDNQAESG
jgi:hypothetical protein